jgi:putative CocE/NonD family hydrolase
MMLPRVVALALLLCGVLAPCRADAPQFEFQSPAGAADATIAAALRDLAERILPVYEEPDALRYLDNLSALQLLAGDYAAAAATRQSLRERRGAAPPPERALLFDLYAQAKALEAAGTPSAQAYSQPLQALLPQLNDREAYQLGRQLVAPAPQARDTLQDLLDRLRPQASLSLDQAIDLGWTYLLFDAARSFAPQAAALARVDQQRRYRSEQQDLPKGADGVAMRLHLVFPKSASRPLPTLLEYSISGGEEDALACAAHGYVGVVAEPAAASAAKPKLDDDGFLPFVNDGAAARAVIIWIARQRWSDGRVGMYGAGYGGFAAWAAAKRRPPALKAIATADAMAPGIDFPMAGGIFRSAALPWAAAAQGLGALDQPRWVGLDQAWYRSGRPFREFDRLAAKPRPSRLFHRWLDHPSYDRYWQKMIPFESQFASIDIPVLQTSGYFAEGEIGARYYFDRHLHYRPVAEQRLLLGPYDDGGARPAPALPPDAAARIDLQELRFQWFDHVFKNGALPALLQDRVNYEVAGADEWRHVPSLAAMSNGRLRLFLEGTATGTRQKLVESRPAHIGVMTQTLDLRQRNDAAAPAQAAIFAGRNLAAPQGLVFASEPLPQSLEVDGQLGGVLDLKPNKQDFDLNLSLYELRPDGEYMPLCAPYEVRASYAGTRSRRRLLRAGERQQLGFSSERLMARRLDAGSRLVLVLGLSRRPQREINYGSGGDVGAESIADAGAPLQLQWFGDSFIDVPVHR